MAEKAPTTTEAITTTSMGFLGALPTQPRGKPAKKAASKVAMAGSEALDSLLERVPKPAEKEPTSNEPAPPMRESKAQRKAGQQTAKTCSERPLSHAEKPDSSRMEIANNPTARFARSATPRKAIAQATAARAVSPRDVFTERRALVHDGKPADSPISNGLFEAEAFVSNDKLHIATKKEGPLRVAAYIRVSTDHENQEDSYEQQDHYFTQLLAENPDWVSAGVYSDYGISATGHARRTGFNRLIRHCREGKVDRIICKSISRFARNTADFMTALAILRDHGVSMMFEKENLDTATPTSEFILTTLGAIAQEESRSISENQKWSIRNRMPKGELQNRKLYGYRLMDGEDAYEVLDTGYRIRRVEIVEDEAAIVRRIFEEYIDGKSFNAIARGLNLDRVPPPRQSKIAKRNSEKARRILNEANGDAEAATEPIANAATDAGWTGSRISYIIKQVRYTGNVLAQTTYVESYLTHKCVRNDGEQPQYYIREHHPAIITEEMFEEAQRIRNLNPNVGRKREAKPLPFSKIILCGTCGKAYNARTSGCDTVWYCPSTSSNWGEMPCGAERLCEAQILRMLRKAIVARFNLYATDLQGKAKEADKLSGGFQDKALLSEKNKDFIDRMIARLEQFQKNDCVEKDRAFGKRKLYALRVEANRAERHLRAITSKLKAAQPYQEMLGQDIPAESLSLLVDAEVKVAKAKKRVEAEEEAFSKKERYWDETEASYGYRQKALEWMSALPRDSKGVVDFLKGMETDHVKAFVLGVIVFDPLHFRVRWYDDTTTDVELHANMDERRCRSKYEKPHLRKAVRFTEGAYSMNEMRGTSPQGNSQAQPPVNSRGKTPKVSVIPATKRAMQAGGQIKSVHQLRVAAYCRVSTGDESQQTSYTKQKAYYTELINRKAGWTMAGIFADEGISGTSTKRRAEFRRMMEEALAGKIDYIVTKSISRFARNTVDTLNCVRQLQKQNPPVGVYFEKENIDTLDAKGELILTILSALAQDESRSISDNIKWTIQKNFRSGKAHVNPSRVFGFREGPNGEWEIQPEQAEVVRYIFKAYLAGKSATRIAKELNSHGYRTGLNKVWRSDSILYVLRNEKYVGDCEMQKTVTESYLTHRNVANEGQAPRIYFTDHHAPIIDRDMWDKAKAMMTLHNSNHRRKRGTSEKSEDEMKPRYSAFGNLTCGDCGGMMIKRSYSTTLHHYSDERSQGFDPKTETELYSMGYGVWRCENAIRKAGQTEPPRCEQASIMELTLQQSFMEMLYRVKRDYTARGEDSDLVKRFGARIYIGFSYDRTSLSFVYANAQQKHSEKVRCKP